MQRIARFALAIVAVLSVAKAQSPTVTFVAGFLLLGALSPPASATAYYMAPNGSDSGDGTITSPWRTFSFASGRLKPGDTLFARGGTYTGQHGNWNSPSGTSSGPIAWKAYPGETPVFDGQNTSTNFLSVVAKDWIILDGMTIKNYRGCCAAIWIGYSGSGTDYAENNAIRNMTILDIGASSQTHGIYCSYGNRHLEISGNLILRTSGAGIHCYHSPGVTNGKIVNNIIAHGNQYSSTIEQWGMVLRNGFSGEIYNNTVIDNKWDIDLGGSGTVIIRNNIISTPLTSPQSGTMSSHNMCLSGTCNGGTGSFTTANPGFVDAANDNYRLTGSSPAIDAGTDVPVADDHEGDARPAGTAYDIGAFEFDNGTRDTLPPSVPSGVTALAESASTISVSWVASTDNIGVTGYEVQRGGVPRAAVTGTLYSDTGLAAGTNYGYRVRARDAAGNWSALSATGSATTDGGSPPPSLGSALTASATSVQPGASVIVAVSGERCGTLDWVGLYAPAESATNLLNWKYLSGSKTAPSSCLTSADLSFTMPTTAGTYEFRLYPNDDFAPLLATSQLVTVVAPLGPSVMVDKTNVAKQGELQVTVTGGPGGQRDWIGLYAAASDNTSYLGWKYLNCRNRAPRKATTSATCTFSIPNAGGAYSFRFFADDGYTLLASSLPVTVN